MYSGPDRVKQRPGRGKQRAHEHIGNKLALGSGWIDSGGDSKWQGLLGLVVAGDSTNWRLGL